MTPPQVIAAVIFIGTIAAMVVRPRGTSEWVWAVTGAVLMIFAGVEPVQLAARAIAARYDVLLFFAGLMVIIAVAEQAGFFGWIAYRAALTARGSQSRLFLAVIAYGAIVAAFLTNDAAALVMTPLIYAFARTMRLSAMPFAFACTFIANGASLALPISNPVNFIIAQAAGLHLFDYLRLLWLPAIVSTSLTGAMLVWVFRRDVRGRFDASQTTVTCSNPRYRLEVTVLLAAAAAALLGA
ncbi:MAG: hypothetical protein GIW99_10685, partial [Candidatus Eremiobacteraeota bacterium]|nr:hypothetical protein [Candidatus Eremiobacteraeota bacterium]